MRKMNPWQVYPLLWSESERLSLHVALTVLISANQSSVWMTDSQSGTVVRMHTHKAHWSTIRNELLLCCLEHAPYHSYVAIEWPEADQASPLLLTKAELSSRIHAITNENSNMMWGGQIPRAIQSFIDPSDGLRYLVAYINCSDCVRCYAFTRSFYQKYQGVGVKHDDPATQDDQVKADVTARSQRRLESLASALVRHIETAHDLALAAIALEFVKDNLGNFVLTVPLHVQYSAGYATDDIEQSILQSLGCNATSTRKKIHGGAEEQKFAKQQLSARHRYARSVRSSLAQNHEQNQQHQVQEAAARTNRLGRKALAQQYEHERKILQKDIQEQEKEADELSQRAHAMRNELEQVSSSHADVVAALESELNQITAQYTQLQQQVETEKKRRMENEARANGKEAELEELRSAIDKQREQTLAEVSEYVSSSAASTRTTDENGTESRRAQAEEALQSEQACIEALKQQLASIEEEIADPEGTRNKQDRANIEQQKQHEEALEERRQRERELEAQLEQEKQRNRITRKKPKATTRKRQGTSRRKRV